MPTSSPAGLHSVRVVARRTGLTPDLLRAWERRYGVVEPSRSAGGQRNYSDADIERLQLLVRCTQGGRQIGQVARLDNEQLRAMLAADISLDERRSASATVDFAVDAVLAKAISAVDRFDAASLESALRSAALRMPSEIVLDHVVGPLLHAIGNKWHEGQLAPANEHLAITTIRRVLSWMTDAIVTRDDAPSIIVGTPAAQNHDLGAMLAATAASGLGWRVTYLGASLPAQELARAAVLASADVVALSIIHPRDDPRLAGELRSLRSALPQSTAIVVGGAGALSYDDAIGAIDATRVHSLVELRQWLDRRIAGKIPRAE